MRLALRSKVAVAVLVVSAVAAAFAFQTAKATRPVPLAAMLPQGALLTIESPDFAALLHAWNASPEQAAWLKSASYSVFSNSRLFGRLHDAQDEFDTAAGVPADADLLAQVAGKQSIFAWYDIGKLEFVYLTRMPASDAAHTTLLQERSKFSRREMDGTAFYVRTTPAGTQGTARTVAFATTGDWLLLATREELMAQTLHLLAKGAPESVASEPWYQDAQEADKQAANPGLHMVLNLDRLVKTPYFRSYWVQRNVSEMGQYRAAVADLYREPGRFREERVLLSKATPPVQDGGGNLGQLAGLAPAGTGLYRAVLSQDAGAAYETLEERLLNRGIGAAPAGTDAPEPDATVEQAGSASEFETRIDAVQAVAAASPGEVPALQRLLAGAGLEASLTVDTAGADAGLWIPFRSAMVLSAARPWDEHAVEGALQDDLRTRLTAGKLGLEWTPRTVDGQSFHVLSGAHPLALAVEGKLCVLANDPALMAALLARVHGAAATTYAPNASLIAGFDHAGQRGPYMRLTALLDGGGNAPVADAGATPAFFHGVAGSLSESFRSLASEQIVEHPDGGNVRQTVTYQWQK